MWYKLLMSKSQTDKRKHWQVGPGEKPVRQIAYFSGTLIGGMSVYKSKVFAQHFVRVNHVERVG
jgi:hypothetical protein